MFWKSGEPILFFLKLSQLITHNFTPPGRSSFWGEAFDPLDLWDPDLVPSDPSVPLPLDPLTPFLALLELSGPGRCQNLLWHLNSCLVVCWSVCISTSFYAYVTYGWVTLDKDSKLNPYGFMPHLYNFQASDLQICEDVPSFLLRQKRVQHPFGPEERGPRKDATVSSRQPPTGPQKKTCWARCNQVWSHDPKTNFQKGSFIDAYPFQRHHFKIPSLLKA